MSSVTRRSFVRTSTRGATALVAGASVLGAPRHATAESPNEKVVLGLIGAGGRGRMVKCIVAHDDLVASAMLAK